MFFTIYILDETFLDNLFVDNLFVITELKLIYLANHNLSNCYLKEETVCTMKQYCCSKHYL